MRLAAAWQALERANAPVFSVDCDGKIDQWNAKAAEVTGFTRGEVFGQALVGFVTEEYISEVKKMLEMAISGESAEGYIFPLLNKRVCTARGISHECPPPPATPRHPPPPPHSGMTRCGRGFLRDMYVGDLA